MAGPLFVSPDSDNGSIHSYFTPSGSTPIENLMKYSPADVVTFPLGGGEDPWWIFDMGAANVPWDVVFLGFTSVTYGLSDWTVQADNDPANLPGSGSYDAGTLTWGREEMEDWDSGHAVLYLSEGARTERYIYVSVNEWFGSVGISVGRSFVGEALALEGKPLIGSESPGRIYKRSERVTQGGSRILDPEGSFSTCRVKLELSHAEVKELDDFQRRTEQGNGAMLYWEDHEESTNPMSGLLYGNIASRSRPRHVDWDRQALTVHLKELR